MELTTTFTSLTPTLLIPVVPHYSRSSCGFTPLHIVVFLVKVLGLVLYFIYFSHSSRCAVCAQNLRQITCLTPVFMLVASENVDLRMEIDFCFVGAYS